MILVVEDDDNLRLVLEDNLAAEGHRVTAVSTAAQARQAVEAGSFDLIILDVMLPDGDGYSLCRDLRARGVRSMVMMLTARTLEDDIVRGFEAGANDYLTKPYRLRELHARTRALLGRSAPDSQVIRFGDLELDHERRTLTRGASAIELTRTEFDLLAFLLANESRALTRDEILDKVWGDVVVDPRTVDNFVSNLKRKLGWSSESGFAIQTIRGVGYRMEVHRRPE